jgi:hypothetical protein
MMSQHIVAQRNEIPLSSRNGASERGSGVAMGLVEDERKSALSDE